MSTDPTTEIEHETWEALKEDPDIGHIVEAYLRARARVDSRGEEEEDGGEDRVSV